MPRGVPDIRKTIATADVTVVTTAETVIVTLAGVSLSAPSDRVRLRGWLQVTIGAGTTSITLRLRRGTDTTGTLVGEANAEGAGWTAASTSEHTIDGEDTPPEVASQSYVLTYAAAGATGNATVVQAMLEAIVGT